MYFENEMCAVCNATLKYYVMDSKDGLLIWFVVRPLIHFKALSKGRQVRHLIIKILYYKL